MTTTIEQLAFRWALHSPEFCLGQTGLLAIAADPARLQEFARDASRLDAWRDEALARYVEHENRFYANAGVATEVSTISEAAHLHIIELASVEHASAALALLNFSPFGKGRESFYNSFDATLRRSLLPRSQFAVAYCNQRRSDLARVRSFGEWNDRAFYEASVITLVRLRARLKIDLPKIQVTINPVPVTIDARRSVTKTVITERLPDGKMVSTVTEE